MNNPELKLHWIGHRMQILQQRGQQMNISAIPSYVCKANFASRKDKMLELGFLKIKSFLGFQIF